jgi:hypothetical protein
VRVQTVDSQKREPAFEQIRHMRKRLKGGIFLRQRLDVSKGDVVPLNRREVGEKRTSVHWAAMLAARQTKKVRWVLKYFVGKPENRSVRSWAGGIS